ncbi:MAG: hypothetical protein ACR2JB_30570 [Bryobacteraceae bacterium]
MSTHGKHDNQNQPDYEAGAGIVKGSLSDHRDEERTHRKLQDRVNFFLVLFTGVTAGVGIWQGMLTHRAIDTANRQAAASEQANAFTRENMESGASQNRAALEASDRQSQAGSQREAKQNGFGREY